MPNNVQQAAHSHFYFCNMKVNKANRYAQDLYRKYEWALDNYNHKLIYYVLLDYIRA
jgi:hypothetical protein